MRRGISKKKNMWLGKVSYTGDEDQQGILTIKFQLVCFLIKKVFKCRQPKAGAVAFCSCQDFWFTSAFQMGRRGKGGELEKGELVPFICKGKYLHRHFSHFPLGLIC